jgi:ParB/RepB/Spo0J family partition protein
MSKRGGKSMAKPVVESEDLGGGSPSQNSELRTQNSSVPPPKADLVLVRIADIDDRGNIRRAPDEPSLLRLAGSIRDLGLLEPVVVCKAPAGSRQPLELLCGGRRLTAAGRNGEEMIEAKVYAAGMDDRQKARIRLAENLHRKDLSHIEYALEFDRGRMSGLSVMEIAADAGASDDFVRKHLDLLRLAQPIQELVASGRLPIKQAELIARVGDHQQQIELANGCIRATWNAKDNAWRPYDDTTDGSGIQHGVVGGGPAGDYAEDMDSLRRAVSYKMQGLASCGWIRGEDQENGEPFAAKAKGSTGRKCTGCPDNSATYADQPALFAGLSPHESDKRGFCTNEACYQAKSAAWEKVREEKKRDEEKRRQAAIRESKKMGLSVCEECGRPGGEEKEDKLAKDPDGSRRQVCPKCRAKLEKAAGGRRSYHDWQAQERKAESIRRRFPETPDQKHAVALWFYGRTLEDAILGRLKKAPTPPQATAVLLRVAIESRIYVEPRQFAKWPGVGALAGAGRWAPAALAELWRKAATVASGKPGIDYKGEAENVPLPKDLLDWIDDCEEVCRRWEIKVKPHGLERPKLEEFAAKPGTGEQGPGIGKKQSGGAGRGVCRECGCTERHACPGGCGWVDESQTLCTQCEPKVKKRISTIATGNRQAALKALAGCGVADLEAIKALKALKGDWRRAVVSKWIENTEGTIDAAGDAAMETALAGGGDDLEEG